MVINTHYHGDHTHGNPGFLPGTQVLSTTRTLEHLQALDAAYWTGDATQFLPNHTFGKDLEIRLGSKTLHLLHPGRGHTDGDLVVLFVEDAALHSGDLFVNRTYPSIDLKAGGTVREWADTLDAALALPFSRVIPGHGALSDRAGVEQFQRFMRQLAAVGADAKQRGLSLTETQREAKLTEDAGYATTEIPMLVSLNRNSVIRSAWEEANGVKRDE
jgi:glyoxylase-like metal-dependent hydrolase (beta-lactamase superfamily II)